MEGEVTKAMGNPGDELVDIIDEADRVIDVLPRRVMRGRRLLHRCTYILVFDREGRLFIHLRTPTKDVYPSYWDPVVGGVLAAGESFAEGARRELQEELGIDAELTELFPVRYSDAATQVRGMAYRVIHDGPFRLQPEEVVRGEFVPVPEVLERAAKQPFCPDGLQVLKEDVARRA